MAEIWGAAIAVAGAVGSAAMQADAAGDASRAAQRGSNAATAEQRRQYDQTRQDTAVYRNIGNQALNALGRIYGYGSGVPAVGDTTPVSPAQGDSFGNALARRIPGMTPGIGDGINGTVSSSGDFRAGPGGSIKRGITIDNNTGQPVDQYPVPAGGGQYPAGATAIGPPMASQPGADYSNFFASPDYQFRRDEGTRGIERSAAAAGLTGSGNALAALADYNSGLAAGEFGNYFNRQAALAGIGQSAVNTTTGAGMNASNNISASLQNAANARASGIGDAADAWGNALGTVAGIAYDKWGRPKKQG